MLPVRGVSLAAIGGTGGLDIAAGALGEVLQLGQQGRGVEAATTAVEIPSAAGVLCGGVELPGA